MPINFADIIEQINRDANVTGSGYFPLVHSANIDFTVEGIVGADASRYDATTFVSTYGTKYIITASDNWSPPPYGNQQIDGGSASDWFDLKANSIVQRGSSSWKTFTDVTNTKSNQGIVVFNKYDNKIYVYSGTEWVEIGSGSLTGAAGQEWSVQFRATDGSLSGSSGLLFDNTSKKLVLGSGVVLQFADGSTQGTARNFFSGESYPVPGGFSASGYTGDRLLLATGPANDPFRNYIRYENQWFQTGVVGVGPQSITGDTISAGYGIDIDRDGNSVTVNNIGVTGFNGLTGNVSMTGAGALVGRGNNTIDARLASSSLTGVASFNSANFTISEAGNVGLTGAVKTINGSAPDPFGNFILDGAVVITGDSGALGGDGARITARLATDSLTGVASFNSTYLTVSNGEVSLASAYQVTGQTVVAGGSSQIVNTSGNTVTIDNRVATSSLTGVASFNSTFFTVSGTGHVSISDTYQQIANGVTGISAGVGINISGATGYVVIKNIGVTSIEGDKGEIRAQNADGGSTGHITVEILEPIARRGEANTYTAGLQRFTKGLSASGGITFGGPIAIQAGSTASVRGSVNFTTENTTKVHRSNNALGTDTGTARKIAMLASDGSLTFDYIRNYDVFKPTDFIFSVGSFSSSISNPILIGNQSYSLNTSSFYGSDLVNGPALTAGMYINTANQGSGFPVYANILSDGGLTFAPGAAVSITAGVAGSVQINLIATGPDEVNGGYATSTKTITFSFVNSFLHGVTSASSLTGGGFTGSWVTRITSNSLNQTFSPNVPSSHFVYYAHPQRLGESLVQINDVGQGGFSLQGVGQVTGVSANSYGNMNGYVENYLFYRSDNSGLGQITVDTGANAGELA